MIWKKQPISSNIQKIESETVHLAGAETITGDKTFSGKLYTDNVHNDGGFENHTSTRYCRYRFNNSAGNMGGMAILDFGNTTNMTLNRITFYEYTPKSTPDEDSSGKYEAYMLPAPTATANKNYDILTTKEAVTVAQGGTGATTVAGARNALGLGNTSGALPIANGGTGSATASAARTALGLGTSATNAVANNLTTTASGSVLDARQGKTLSDNKARRITGIVDHGETVTLSMENDYGVLFIGNSTANCIAWVWESTVLKIVDNSSSVTLTKTSKSLKIQNTSASANYRYYLIC